MDYSIDQFDTVYDNIKGMLQSVFALYLLLGTFPLKSQTLP